MKLSWQRMNVIACCQLFVLHPDVVEAKRDGQSQGAADSYAMQCIDSVEMYAIRLVKHAQGYRYTFYLRVPENLAPPAPEPRLFGPGDLERLGG
ncbi:uncharacterized protein EAF02_007562 [Botrytis sinoallii]|uniref:uncharacterized protein n=1 Tax=Botrytis sinoallii TaxID=1463999 RepID=UPI001901D071|nr:uncharacterized protein EAF02_007562 [Botrytis sinoallii]KAF7879925.1 hypothetical protein EAF02_007562 [Botrytis sinoallii]